MLSWSSHQDGTPADLFERPAGPFVLDFLGSVNIFHGRVENGRAHLGPLSVAYPDAQPDLQPERIRFSQWLARRRAQLEGAASIEVLVERVRTAVADDGLVCTTGGRAGSPPPAAGARCS